jgi:homopolymeric O-antigen transport system permease protein
MDIRRMLSYRDLILALVARELKVRYRRSALGFFWTMLHPVLMMIVLHFVFGTLFRSELSRYPVYVLVGILFWNFFSQTLVASMNSLRGNAPLLQKLPLPGAIFPLATMLAGVVNLMLALLPLVVILAFSGSPPGLALLFVPIAIALMAVFTLGFGLLLAPLAVFFTDIVEMTGMVLTLVLYLTPIFYPVSILPRTAGMLVRGNPLAWLLEAFRAPICQGQLAPLWQLIGCLLAAIGSLLVGALAFRRSSARIPYAL